MAKDLLGIGVIGSGFGSLVHVPAFRSIEGCTVMGIASGSPEHAESAAKQHGIPLVFPRWEDLIASPEIHAVSITTPPKDHAAIAVAAASAGKHILCEKPFALTVVEAQNMLASAEEAKIVHMVNFEFRDLPAFQELYRLLHTSSFPQIRHVSVQWIVGSWANPERPWGWQCDRALGGGVLGAFGVHVLDYIEWFFGPIAALSATLSIAIHKRKDPMTGRALPVTAPDTCTFSLVMQAGFTVDCTVSNVATAETEMGHYVTVTTDDRTLVAGSSRVDDYGSGFFLREMRDGQEKILSPKSLQQSVAAHDGRIALMLPILRRFVDAIHTGSRIASPSFCQGLRTQILLDAIDRSAMGKVPVDIPLS